MDDLPQELICHVFRLATHEVEPYSCDVHTLLAITGTCRQWRAISIEDGHLWTRIALNFLSLARDISRSVAFLIRSKTYPLSIHIDMRDPFWDFDEDSHGFTWQDMEAIVRMLVVHAHRWRSFTLLTDTWSPMFTFLWYTRQVEEMSLLQTLSLARCNMFLAGEGQAFQPVTLRQPRHLFGGITLRGIRNVSLIGVHVDWDTAPLSNLERLELKYIPNDVAPSLDQLRKILERSPNLTQLSIHGLIPCDLIRGNSSLLIQQISLPTLKSLSLGFLTPSFAAQLISLFDFTRIDELILDDISAVIAPDTTHDSTLLFRHLIDHHHSQFRDLQTLKLIGIRCSTDIFTSCLHSFNLISSLSLFNVPNDVLRSLDDLSAHARPAGPSGRICPALTELHCQDVDPEVLIAVVNSRNSTGHHALQNVSLEFARSSSPSIFSPIYQRLADLGVTVIQKMTRASQASTYSSSFS